MAKGYHDSKTPTEIRDLWRTPQAVFDYYDKRFNFTTDVAASKSNALCNKFYDKDMNSLDSYVAWGSANWCNPPFSDVTPWIKKAVNQAKTGRLTVMLLPADTSVKWFKLAFENCSECHFISGRLAFISEETGKPVSGNNKGSVVFVFDPNSQFKSQVCLIDRNDIMNSNR